MRFYRVWCVQHVRYCGIYVLQRLNLAECFFLYCLLVPSVELGMVCQREHARDNAYGYALFEGGDPRGTTAA
jgi:hypothetical protein